MAGSTPVGRVRGGQRQPVPAQLNWRLYRLCLAPVAVALLICAFSFSSPPAPLSSSLSPEAFEGGRALAQLQRMATIAPRRRPGSRGDARLLAYIEAQLGALGGPGSGGYRLQVVHRSGETPWGRRELRLLIASRAGAGSLPPIALIAHRDSALTGAPAQLSGTAVLLELANVLAQTETRHPVYVIVSDDGSGGAASSAQWLGALGRLDAAIVLGDLGGSTLRTPLVQPYSAGLGDAPEVLSGTLAGALRSNLGMDPGMPSLASQLAHLAFPLTTGEQGPLNAAGIPSVQVSLAGERGETAGEPVDQARLQAVGSAVLSAFYALDRGRALPAASSAGLRLSGRVLPQWPIALLALSLLIAPLALACDALVRIARRGRRVGRWLALAPFCAWPFALSAASLRALAAVGVLHAPANPLPADALSFDAGSLAALIVAVGVLMLCWRLWLRLAPAAGFRAPARSAAAGPAALCGGCLLSLLVWLVNPYASLLGALALHLWLVALCPRRRPGGRAARLAIVLAPALAPLALLIAFYALSLGLSPAGTLLEGMVMIGGGSVSLGGVLAWSLAVGTLVAVALAVLGAGGAPSRRLRLPPLEEAVLLRPEQAPVYRERVAGVRDTRALR